MYNQQRASGLLGDRPNTNSGLLPLPQSSNMSRGGGYDSDRFSDEIYERRGPSRLLDDFDDFSRERRSDMGVRGMSDMDTRGMRNDGGAMSLLSGNDSSGLLGNQGAANQQNLLGNVAAQISLVNSLLQKASGVGLADLQSLASLSNQSNQSVSNLSMSANRGLDYERSQMDMNRSMSNEMNRGMSSMSSDMNRGMGSMSNEFNRGMTSNMNRGMGGDLGRSLDTGMNRGMGSDLGRSMDTGINRGMNSDLMRGMGSDMSRGMGGGFQQPKVVQKRPTPLLDMDVGQSKRTRYSSGASTGRSSGALLPSPSSQRRDDSRRRSGERKSRFSDSNDRPGRSSDRGSRSNSRRDSPPRSRPSLLGKPSSSDEKSRDRRSSDTGKEKYDPSQPTDDEIGAAAGKSESGGRSRSPKRDVTKDMKVTIENSDGKGKDDNQSPFHCHVCNIDCASQKSFTHHMQSKKHGDRMNQMFLYQKEQEAQNQARRVAERHLRQIEGKKKRCKVCDREYLGDAISHRRTTEHKRKERLVSRGCPLCKITKAFESYPEYVKHISGNEHKKNKSKIPQSMRKDYDDEFPDNLDGLVTIDAIGEFSDEEMDDNDVEEESQTKESSDAKPPKKENNEVVMKKKAPQAEQEEKVESVKQESSAVTVTSPQPVKSEPVVADEPEPETELEELPEFDPKTPQGQEHVIAVSGFFCKLCHKFYNSKNAALVTHCQSKPHYDKLKVVHKRKQKRLVEALSKSMPSPDHASQTDSDTIQNQESANNSTQESEMVIPDLQIVSVTSLSEWSGGDAMSEQQPVQDEPSPSKAHVNKARRGGKVRK